jgi:hypothetical protein
MINQNQVKQDGTGNILGSEERIVDQEGTEIMDIPLRRVVALTAAGLVTGALLRLIYEALRETKS